MAWTRVPSAVLYLVQNLTLSKTLCLSSNRSCFSEPSLLIDTTDSPTRSHFGDDEPRGMLDRLRKPGSMSSFTSIFNGRKNTNSPGSLFKHASSNASKASLALASNPLVATAILGMIAESTLRMTSTILTLGLCQLLDFESKFPFGSTSAAPGDVTPRV